MSSLKALDALAFSFPAGRVEISAPFHRVIIVKDF
jgi:hypothetical protein